jgi:hypothetical protein
LWARSAIREPHMRVLVLHPAVLRLVGGA